MRSFLALALLATLSSAAHAETACPQFFADGKAPALSVQGEGATVELCNEAFATLWSPVSRDPVYSAEHLTPAGLTAADKTARLDAFHADERLPAHERALLGDYKRGDYDRGHLAPAHDMPTASAMHESFLLSNMAPQDPAANRGQWSKVEEFTRRLVILGKGAYVVTLLSFDEHPQRLNGRIAIPAAYIKAVYVEPNQFAPDGQVGAYALANTADAKPETISLDEVKRRTGIDPFPSLSPEQHAKATLPPVASK